MNTYLLLSLICFVLKYSVGDLRSVAPVLYDVYASESTTKFYNSTNEVMTDANELKSNIPNSYKETNREITINFDLEQSITTSTEEIRPTSGITISREEVIINQKDATIPANGVSVEKSITIKTESTTNKQTTEIPTSKFCKGGKLKF